MSNLYALSNYIPVVTIVNLNGSVRVKLDYLASAMASPRLRISSFITSSSAVLVGQEYKYSPDLISQDSYGSPYLWWALCRYNAIVNPLDTVLGIVPGRTLGIPSVSAMRQWLQALGVSNTQINDLVTV